PNTVIEVNPPQLEIHLFLPPFLTTSCKPPLLAFPCSPLVIYRHLDCAQSNRLCVFRCSLLSLISLALSDNYSILLNSCFQMLWYPHQDGNFGNSSHCSFGQQFH